MTISRYFKLGKSQSELDFVDIPTNADIRLFIDPFAISQRENHWAIEAHSTITNFFQQVINAIRARSEARALYLLSFLHEPNETHLGLSSGVPQGAGIGKYQAEQLYEALQNSTAVKVGFIQNLEECELLVPNISHDKISDLSTNIIRAQLVQYTNQQANLLGMPVAQVALRPFFNRQTGNWETAYGTLPLVKGKPVLLVPKVIARWTPAYDHRKYYQHFVLNYLQSENLNAQTALVRTLQNGSKVVFKEDLKATYPLTKEFLFNFTREHPEVLAQFRERLASMEEHEILDVVTPDDEPHIAAALIESLRNIPPGDKSASDYHRLMIGIIEFIFFPNLLNPIKEQEIHEGRKRIDILVENGAKDGVFHRLHDVKHLPCGYVPIECKNYSRDVANPELDQLSGRFAVNRGQFGLLACRELQDRPLFIRRCQDTFRDQRGLIIPLEDAVVIELLEMIRTGRRAQIDNRINELVSEVWLG